MKTLDFGAIMREEPDWWANYDLTCPFCDGKHYIETECWTVDCNDCKEQSSVPGDEFEPETCPKCGSQDVHTFLDSITDECEECDGEGEPFEVLWNTAFGVALNSITDEDRKLAWTSGFCLIEHDDAYYLLMGSCGQDNTWRVHWLCWRLQGRYLSPEDIDACLDSGGYVFLEAEHRKELMQYFRDAILTPEEYVSTYECKMAKLDRIDEVIASRTPA